MNSTLAELIRDGRSGRVDCPAKIHSSAKTVAVRSLEDGTVILKDHAGCETAQILRAAGLDWLDLFPARGNNAVERKRHKENKRAAEEVERLKDLKFRQCCQLLLNVHTLINDAGVSIKFATEHGLDDEPAWRALDFAYRTQLRLEEDFELLLHSIPRGAR